MTGFVFDSLRDMCRIAIDDFLTCDDRSPQLINLFAIRIVQF